MDSNSGNLSQWNLRIKIALYSTSLFLRAVIMFLKCIWSCSYYNAPTVYKGIHPFDKQDKQVLHENKPIHGSPVNRKQYFFLHDVGSKRVGECQLGYFIFLYIRTKRKFLQTKMHVLYRYYLYKINKKYNME